MILLDTQAVVWYFEGAAALGEQARSTIESAFSDRDVYVSPAVFLEVATLHRRSRLTLVRPVGEWMKAVLASCRVAEMTPDIAIDAGTLPDDVHGDPMDRIMMATARYRNCPLVTSDGKILACANAGLLRAIDARR